MGGRAIGASLGPRRCANFPSLPRLERLGATTLRGGLAVLALAFACGDDATEDAGPELDDAGRVDAAVDAGPAADAGEPAACGDGVVDPLELCDGPDVPCAELSAHYTAGVATCRAGCRGYDVSACELPASRLWELIEPASRDPRWSRARCNDGTPFDLVYRPGAPGSRVWVVYLEGGGFGDDHAFPTAARGPELTSTWEVADGVRGPLPGIEHGLFGGEAINPDFHDAHLVYAHYCSSDLWSGRGEDRRPVAGTELGMYFAGRHNVVAMLEILVQRYGLDDADPDLRVLWGGASAGCIGATQTADHAVEALPVTAAAGRLRVLADGAYLVPTPASEPDLYYGAATVDDVAVLDRAVDYWDARPLSACTADRPGECYHGRGFYPALRAMGLPVLVAMSVMDEVVLALKGACTEGCGPGGPTCLPGCSPLTEERYAAFRALYREDFTDTGVEWLFAWGTPEHTAGLVDARWNGPPGASEPLRGLVGEMFFDRGPPRVVYVNGADR